MFTCFQAHEFNIENKSVAIVHGTANGKVFIYLKTKRKTNRFYSEDVHFKHSATLVKNFIRTGINFQYKVKQ